MIPTGKTRCYRFSTPDQVTSFNIPSDISWCILKNTSLTISVKFNFDSDAAGDYYTLDPGEVSHAFCVYGGKTLNTDGVGGSSNLEVIAWG